MEMTSIQWKSVGRWFCIFYIRLLLQKLNVQTVYKFEGTDYRLSDLRPTFWSRDKLCNLFQTSFFFFSKESFHSVDEMFGLKTFLECNKLFVNLFLFFFFLVFIIKDKRILAKIEFNFAEIEFSKNSEIGYCDIYC